MTRITLETVALLGLLGACAFGGAGRLDWLAGWLVLGAYGIFAAAAVIFVDPDLLRERAKPGPGVVRGDVVVSTLGFLALYPATFLVAGLDAVRFGPVVEIPTLLRAVAFLLFVAGYALAFRAMQANPFFATFVRVQEERGHRVVMDGPYARVRHPGYAGALVAHLALPIALGSVWALVPAVLGVALFVVRTAREDRYLAEHLPGYAEYRERVPWRLVPGLW